MSLVGRTSRGAWDDEDGPEGSSPPPSDWSRRRSRCPARDIRTPLPYPSRKCR